MSQLIKLTCIAVLFVVVLNKSWQVWRAPDDRPLRSATLGLVSATAALVVGQQPVDAFLDGVLLGLPRLLINIAMAGAFFGLLGFFMYSVHGERAGARLMRRHWIVFASLIVVAVAAWSTASSRVRAQPATPTTGGHWPASVFLLCVVAAMLYALVLSLRYAVRAARHASRVRLRRGLRVLSLGVTALIAGCLLSVALVGAAWLVPPGAALWTWLRVGYLLAMLVGVVGLAAGLSYPIVASLREAVPRWLRHRREYRALKPLWRAVNRAFPDLELSRSYRPWNVHRLRYRCAIEIRDALVQLGPYYRRSGDGGTPAAVGVEDQAAEVVAALHARATGSAAGESPHPIPVAGTRTFDDEVRWLVAVSRAMPADVVQRCALQDDAASG